MGNKKSTKRALISSVLSLVLCMSMLIGTTFAWFTDSATSSGNKIQAGNLDVDLYMWNGLEDNATNRVEITNASAPIFGAGSLAQDNNAQTLWEPGKTQVAYLSIKNNGSLALKYKVAIDVKNSVNNLHEVMQYAITPDAKFGQATPWTTGTKVELGTNEYEYKEIALGVGEEHFFALSVHMLEEAGNEYMNGSVDFDIRVLAGQQASEADSFGNTYDQYASYAGSGFAAAPAPGEVAKEIEIRDDQEAKVGTVLVPAEAVADGVKELKADIKGVEYNGNITVAAGKEKQSFDISVTGIKEGNTTPMTVEVRMPAGLDPATFELYHYDTPVGCDYDPVTGYVTFETTGFSPFTIVYDKDSVWVPPVVDKDTEAPKAIVTGKNLNETPGYSETETWGSYGQWSPNYSVDANPKLEAAYVFECEETAEEAALNKYAYWHCDFYVKLNRDLAPNQIFLGGNYGTLGWVGFHNGDVTLKANEEIPLLGSVTTNPWTYLDVAQYVGTFTCGVGDVNNALAGATFTVELRLTNPDNPDDIRVINKTTHTFAE